MDVIKERERKRTVDDKGREIGKERKKERTKEREEREDQNRAVGENKGGSERKSHSPITAVE